MERRHWLRWAAMGLVVLWLGGCPSEDDPDPPKPAAEKLSPEPAKPLPPEPDSEARISCAGDNAPKAMKGNAIELVGYVRTLADPGATSPPPKAQVEAFTTTGDSLGKSFADPQKGKDGRVSLTVPVKKDGFTGYALVTHAGFVDWRLKNSRPVTSTEFNGWAWLTTPAEVESRSQALGVTQDAANGLLVGAVHDCDGFGVQYAVVQIDGKTDGIFYVEGFDLSKDRTFTSDTGRFVLANATPGKHVIKAFGRFKKGGPLTLLSMAEASVVAGTMTAVAMQPRAGVEK